MDTMGMSDLQISLVVIGGAVVVGVALFNCVQQRRFRRSAEGSPASSFGGRSRRHHNIPTEHPVDSC